MLGDLSLVEFLVGAFVVAGFAAVIGRFVLPDAAHGRPLPAIVDRSIGMYVVRRARGRLTGGPSGSPTAASSSVVAEVANVAVATGRPPLTAPLPASVHDARPARAGSGYQATAARLAAVGIRRAVPAPPTRTPIVAEPSSVQAPIASPMPPPALPALGTTPTSSAPAPVPIFRLEAPRAVPTGPWDRPRTVGADQLAPPVAPWLAARSGRTPDPTAGSIASRPVAPLPRSGIREKAAGLATAVTIVLIGLIGVSSLAAPGRHDGAVLAATGRPEFVASPDAGLASPDAGRASPSATPSSRPTTTPSARPSR